MKVFRSIEEIQDLRSPVVTIGTFDGVHLGHRAVIEQLNKLALSKKTESLLITFEPHPRIVLNKDVSNLRFINNPDEKVRLLAKTGVNNLLILPFTYEFSKITARDFIEKYLIDQLNVQAMIVGYDHHFGSMNSPSEDVFDLLNEYNIDVERIPEQDIKDVSVSSTKIRNAISKGNIIMANEFLNYKYGLCGTVVHGNKIGRTLGFPTANIMLNFNLKLLPKDGVYAGIAQFKGQSIKAMLNIGFKPTLHGTVRSIEIHLFDFDQMIYGEFLEVQLFDKIRDEQAFSNVESLKIQLEKDKLNALKILHTD